MSSSFAPSSAKLSGIPIDLRNRFNASIPAFNAK
jgi:hypothetical protein